MDTALTRLVGVRHPIVQTGMGWVAGPRLVSATADAGALGVLASAAMTLDRLREAVREVKSRTDAPFGVNPRADAADAGDRVRVMIEEGVRVASFALVTPLRCPSLFDELEPADVTCPRARLRDDAPAGTEPLRTSEAEALRNPRGRDHTPRRIRALIGWAGWLTVLGILTAAVIVTWVAPAR